MSTVLDNTSIGLGKNSSAEGKADYYRTMILEVKKDIRSLHPIKVIRKRLLAQIYETAQLQVLLLEIHPTEEWKNAYTQGLTGELGSKLIEIINSDNALKTYFYGLNPSPKTFEELYQYVLHRYWVCHLYMGTYNAVRIALGDYHSDPQKDWFRPCYTSMCIWHEHLFRMALKLPPALCFRDSPMKAAAHSLWIQTIDTVTPEPRLHWENQWKEMFNEPSPYSIDS